MPVDSEVTYSVGDQNVEGRTPAIARLQVSRAVYDQPSFDITYGLCDPGPPLNPWESIKKRCRRKWERISSKRKCGSSAAYRTLVNWIPFIGWIQKYDVKSNLFTDTVAGITVGVMNVPQGMAYALLAACPAVTGLYTSIFPVIIYLLMGTSRQCSLGTFSIISMMTSKLVAYANPYKAFDRNGTLIRPDYNDRNNTFNGTSFTWDEWGAIQVGSLAAFYVGIWQIVLGIIGAGGLSVYLSDQLVQGFTCSASFHVFSSQLKSVFRLKMTEYYGPFKLIKTWIQFFQLLPKAHVPSVVLSLISLVILVGIKIGINDNKRIMAKIRVPIPAELIVVIAATVASYFMDLEHNYKVDIVKKIPQGMPLPTVPDFTLSGLIIGDTISNAIVGLAITVTLGMLYASKHNYSINPNQEFKAQGVGNIFGSFFQCFPSGASLARSAVQNDVGGKTQIVSLVQCIIVIIAVCSLGKSLEPLPKPALGAIVMASVLHLLSQVVQLHKLWKLSLSDWSIFLVVFFGVLILDVDLGLYIGVGWAIMTVMLRLQKPKVGPLGRLPGTDIYRRTDVYKTACEIPGVKIVRVDAPVYFANAAYIKHRLYTLADLNNLIIKYKEANPVKETTTPAVDDERREYAYSLNLALDNDNDEHDEHNPVRRYSGSRSEPSTISMEQLNNSFTPRTFLAQESVLGDNNTENGEDVPVKHLIVDCSEICFIDVTGVGFLKKCQIECESIGVELLLAATNKPTRDLLYVCGANEYIKEYQLFVTVHDAVLYAVNVQKFKKNPTLYPFKETTQAARPSSGMNGHTNSAMISPNNRLEGLMEISEGNYEEKKRHMD
ncbi:Solute carrier family 26 member 6 [Hypsibius exemplaris]|uniref:Solute carrier family 26 member 6 n=1 Tax=Hypsibius exemplaris TaxID=2072580 RepID=A0A1W0X8G9_HYPEX|nr:Solute carrier family 26 member 6 [Hypsibius exemplaris]